LSRRKEDIIVAARRLFGEQGYSAVSMRDIADELDISVGNLTYYFRRKEDLIEAVVMDDYRTVPRGEIPTDLHGLQQLWEMIMESHAQRSYYLRHYAELETACPTAFQFQGQLADLRYRQVIGSFEQLEKDGLMEPEFYPGQRKELMRVISTLYLYIGSVAKCQKEEDVSRAGVRCFWSVVFPCLTEKGREIVRGSDWAWL